ncbi:hypothetical protein XH88_01830 [Bradyrhizobium sp. CCBAU 51627]|nr:hypothetical protein [Bradyrhizobium sp. CCBAU 51627]
MALPSDTINSVGRHSNGQKNDAERLDDSFHLTTIKELLVGIDRLMKLEFRSLKHSVLARKIHSHKSGKSADDREPLNDGGVESSSAGKIDVIVNGCTVSRQTCERFVLLGIENDFLHYAIADGKIVDEKGTWRRFVRDFKVHRQNSRLSGSHDLA